MTANTTGHTAAHATTDPDEDPAQYKVVVNDEDQYSIWPADRDDPPGWTEEGFSGSRAACLDHVAHVWTDMRPASLRRVMDGTAPAP